MTYSLHAAKRILQRGLDPVTCARVAALAIKIGRRRLRCSGVIVIVDVEREKLVTAYPAWWKKRRKCP